MKTSLHVAAVVLLALLAHGHALAQEQYVNLLARPVLVRFAPPPGVQIRPSVQVAPAPGQKEPDQFVFSDAASDLLIIVLVVESAGGEKAASEFLAGLKASQERLYPKLEWLARDQVTLGGRRWDRLLLRGTSPAGDEAVKALYVTEWGGRHIMFSFSSRPATYEARRAELEKSAATIELSGPASAARPGGPAARRPQPRGRRKS